MEEIRARQSVAVVPGDPVLDARRAALLELGASYRLLRAAVTAVSDRPREVASLPRLVLASGQDEPRVAAIARAYFSAVNGEFSAPTFSFFIHALQAHEPFNVEELWSIGPFFRFALLEAILGEAHQLLDFRGKPPAPLLLARLKSLRSISNADWPFLMEPLIALDFYLRQDPAETFAKMDFESREFYRKRVALVARHSDCTEIQVAQAALELAQQGRQLPSTDPRVQRRACMLAITFSTRDFPSLPRASVSILPLSSTRARLHPRPWRRLLSQRHSDSSHRSSSPPDLLPFRASVFSIAWLWRFHHCSADLPAMQAAVDLVNNAITAFFDPEPLPKLDFSHGIPADCTTLVAVPSLLLNEKQVRRLVNDLEVRFLANRDPHLHFALLTDLPDSVSKPRTNDSHPLVELAVRLINELNAKYDSPRNGGFILLHRHRVFNVRQGVWMGWERKRGKLLDLNKLLAGELRRLPHQGRPPRSARASPLRAHARLRHAASSRRCGAAGRRHRASAAIRRSSIPRLRIVTEGYRHPAAAHRRQRPLRFALAAGGHLLRPERIRHLHARHLRRLPGSLWRRHIHRQGHL